jgi:septal ring factor EnvC (AmiA/AmiB activator)
MPLRLVRLRTPIKPIPGKVARSLRYGNSSSGLTFLGEAGQSVAAPEAGRVVFAQDFLSYGLLLIIENAPEYHTLLWGFARLDVEADDRVRAGQVVGVMGAGKAQAAELHLEIRRNGRPVNPSRWLAASNSKVRS